MKNLFCTFLILIITQVCGLLNQPINAQSGTLDPSFGIAGKVTTSFKNEDRGRVAIIQRDGKIVVAGYCINGSKRDVAIIRYMPDGSLDNSFDFDGTLIKSSSAVDDSWAIALQDDGKIIVVWTIFVMIGNANGDYYNEISILRLNIDGSFDTSFGTGGVKQLKGSDGYGRSVAIQKDGKIIIAGDSYTGRRFLITRISSDGSLDKNFNSTGIVSTRIGNTSDVGRSVVIQPDGKIVVAGESNNGQNYDIALVRYNENGSLDSSFAMDGILTTSIGSSNDYGRSVKIQQDGKIVVAGSSFNGISYDIALLRYNVDGTLDDDFNGNGILTDSFGSHDDIGRSVTIQQEGKIIIAGDSYNGSNIDLTIARYNENGSRDLSFGVEGKIITDFGFDEEAYSVIIQTDGKIILAGSSINDNSNIFVTRYNEDGSLDNSFQANGKLNLFIGRTNVYGKSIALQKDGKIILTGYHSSSGYFLARYNDDGNLDNTFNSNGKVIKTIPHVFSRINAVALQNDGKIVLAGRINQSQASDFLLIRHLEDGRIDSSFGLNGIVITDFNSNSDEASSILVQDDGKIVVGGSSRDPSLNAVAGAFALVRYNENGTEDPTFKKSNTSFGGRAAWINAIVFQKDGKIIASGASNENYKYRGAIVRYNSDGTLDNSFTNGGKILEDLGQSLQFYSMAIQQDGKIIMTGHDSHYNIILYRYNPDGKKDFTFDQDGLAIYDLGNEAYGDAVAIQPNGKIIIACRIYDTSNKNFNLLRVNKEGSLDKSFGSNGRTSADFSKFEDANTCLVFQSDGRILVGGRSFNGNNFDAAIARFYGDGVVANNNTDLELDKTVAYPNPGTGLFTIKNDFDDLTRYYLSDSKGAVLLSSCLSKKENTIDLSNFDVGVYLLKLGNQTLKMIKNK